MAVKIRLQRAGKKKMPYYRVVAVDGRDRRDGVVIDEVKVITWLRNGAQPTETIQNLLKKSGIWKKFKEAK